MSYTCRTSITERNNQRNKHEITQKSRLHFSFKFKRSMKINEVSPTTKLHIVNIKIINKQKNLFR